MNLNAFVVSYAYAATTAILKKFHPQAYSVCLACAFKVSEMEAMLEAHDFAMPSRELLEALAEKFRYAVNVC